MRNFPIALFASLALVYVSDNAGAQSTSEPGQWPPAAIAESPNRALAKPIHTTLTFPQYPKRRYERSTPASRPPQSSSMVYETTPPPLVSSVIELPPRVNRSEEELAKQRVWEQIRERERRRAEARRARIAYRKAIGYSVSRPTIRGSIIPPRIVYPPQIRHGAYRR